MYIFSDSKENNIQAAVKNYFKTIKFSTAEPIWESITA